MKSEPGSIRSSLKRLLEHSLLRRTMRGGLITSIALLTGCVNNVEIGDHSNSPSLGEQLVELHLARQAGAISEGEYNRMKLKLVRGR